MIPSQLCLPNELLKFIQKMFEGIQVITGGMRQNYWGWLGLANESGF